MNCIPFKPNKETCFNAIVVHRYLFVHIYLFFNSSAHSITSDIDIAETARAAELFRSDGVIVTGTATGAPVDGAELTGPYPRMIKLLKVVYIFKGTSKSQNTSDISEAESVGVVLLKSCSSNCNIFIKFYDNVIYNNCVIFQTSRNSEHLNV